MAARRLNLQESHSRGLRLHRSIPVRLPTVIDNVLVDFSRLPYGPSNKDHVLFGVSFRTTKIQSDQSNQDGAGGDGMSRLLGVIYVHKNKLVSQDPLNSTRVCFPNEIDRNLNRHKDCHFVTKKTPILMFDRNFRSA